MKLYVPISTDSNDSVKRGYAVAMITELAGCEVHIQEMGDSHADRACNKMANAFLKTDCEAMLIIDCDVTFTRHHIARMIGHLERGVKAVWGLYPKKQEDTPPCVCTFETVPVPDEHGLSEVRRSGRGFLMVHRSVFEALKEDNGGPALRYHNHGEVQWCFFWSGVVTDDTSAVSGADEQGFPQREWLSEDWNFCETIRKHLGIPTLIDTGIALGHIGSKHYSFRGEQLTRMDSHISSWREIDGWFDFEDLYRDFAKSLPRGGRFAEVGCWLGRSLGALAEFARDEGKVIEIHAVDTFCGTPASPTHHAILNAHGGNVEKAFRANMKACGLNGELTVHPRPSVEAAGEFSDGSLDAVFIDADHRKEYVIADISAWLPKVKPGGILAGHDIDEDGVAQAVAELVPQARKQGRCWVYEIPN